MITKERFIELVNKKAKIFGISKNNQVFAVGLKYRDITEDFINKQYEALKDFYETKEDAEWHLKYTVTVRLELPTWEEIQNMSKENYIKACDLCMKLFKGEEV